MVDPADDAKRAIFGELVAAAAANPDIRQAGTIVATTIRNLVLPLAVVNFAIEKARVYFQGGAFESDLAEKLLGVPPDEIRAPKASIAGPALQGLAYSFEEDELREMYLRLIASAMDGREPSKAHPAFVDVIRQLSAREAELLRIVLPSSSGIPAVEVRLTMLPDRKWVTLIQHLTSLIDEKTGLPEEVPEFPAIVDNWIRLGLVTATYSISMTTMGQPPLDLYHWVKDRPEYKRLRESSSLNPKTEEIIFERGIIKRTAFGARFMLAVGLRAEAGPTRNQTLFNS